MDQQSFFTFQDYLRNHGDVLTPSMEDYLEMIYRLSQDTGYTRVNQLAEALNVLPPSVSKMIRKLNELKLIKNEKYGVITLLPEGQALGKALIERHHLVESFLALINIKEDRLKETEKLEHMVNDEVLSGLNDLLLFFQAHPEIKAKFFAFRKEKDNGIDKKE